MKAGTWIEAKRRMRKTPWKRGEGKKGIFGDVSANCLVLARWLAQDSGNGSRLLSYPGTGYSTRAVNVITIDSRVPGFVELVARSL